MVRASVILALSALLTGGDDPPSPSLPRVLILGDSISMGYTPFVRELLEDEAIVVRPMINEESAENCAGTTKGVEHLDRWLAIDSTREPGDGAPGHHPWDVIHFNFGLHDLKRVHPETKKSSNEPEHPRQAEPDLYEKQLREIVRKLRKTGATLIYATTTPVPEGGVRPLREVEDPGRYNAIAAKIMKEHDIVVNDLYTFILPRCEKLQRPVDVHFTREGSEALAEQVAAAIRVALVKR